MYRSMLWFFLIGAVSPIVLYLLDRRFPRATLRKVPAPHTYRLRCPLTINLDPPTCNLRIHRIDTTSHRGKLHGLGYCGALFQRPPQAQVPTMVDEVQLHPVSRTRCGSGSGKLSHLLLPGVPRCSGKLVWERNHRANRRRDGRAVANGGAWTDLWAADLELRQVKSLSDKC